MLWSFGNVVVIWHILLRFGILCHEKSGNPDQSYIKIPSNFLNIPNANFPQKRTLAYIEGIQSI
jgi:hypothetical protein